MVRPLGVVLLMCTTPSALQGQSGDRPSWDPGAPRPTPMPFADGSLRTVNGIAFTPDGRQLYLTEWLPDRRAARIVEWRFAEGRWDGPHAVPFGSTYNDYQPVMAPGGERLYFQSTRPAPGSETEGLQDLWYVDRVGSRWSAPRHVSTLNTPAREGYAAPVAGGALYFNSDRPGGLGGQDFYRAVPSGDGFAPPEPVRELNTVHGENDLYVDPRERFVIFNRFIEATRDIDLYLSVRTGNGWGPPRLLDAVNAPGVWELTPTVTPDGRYLLFTINMRIMQVELRAVLTPEERAVLDGAR